MLVDLEGEARRPLDERRGKALPLTDVAGMLRSFDQAAWASVFRFAEATRCLRAAAGAALAWRDLARAAFLEEYRAAIAGCPSWPGDDAADALLRSQLSRTGSDARAGRQLGRGCQLPGDASPCRCAALLDLCRSPMAPTD